MMTLLQSHKCERHDHPEGLVVTRGEIQLFVEGESIAMKEGSMFVVPAGVLHSVETRNDDRVVIFD
jgi:quercetin dioxygenase-like cupin family protein